MKRDPDIDDCVTLLPYVLHAAQQILGLGLADKVRHGATRASVENR